MKADAVFEGGGVKGLALVGALWAAEERGYTWENVAGTSAGAIVAALVAVGYTAAEIKVMMQMLNLECLKDSTALDKIPLIGPVLSLGFQRGLNKGDYLERWLRAKLAAKGVRTFGDLLVPDQRNYGELKYRLSIIAADISRGRMLILPQDIAEYGTKPEELDIATAVRMSMSIPLFYRPVQWVYRDNKGKQCVSYIVDGAILSNYPVWLFDNPGRPNWPTFGFRLVDSNSSVDSAALVDSGDPDVSTHKVHGPVSLISAVVYTMMEAHDRKYIKEADFARTIAIPTLGVKTTDFDISRAKKEELFQSGVRAAEKFFGKWDFRVYLTNYRSGTLV